MSRVHICALSSMELFAIEGVAFNQSFRLLTFDAVVLTVAHTAFLEMNFDSLTNKNHVLYDVKNILPTTIKHGGL